METGGILPYGVTCESLKQKLEDSCCGYLLGPAGMFLAILNCFVSGLGDCEICFRSVLSRVEPSSLYCQEDARESSDG